MDGTPFQKGLPWLISGLLLVIVSAALCLYDQDRSDEELITQVERGIQADFSACLAYYSSNAPSGEVPACEVCVLEYDHNRQLISWTNNSFLPPADSISNIGKLPDPGIVTFDKRSYYQLRHYEEKITRVFLIPLSINYGVDNQLLVPYTFLGRWRERLSTDLYDVSRLEVSIGESEVEHQVRIYGPSDRTILSINNLQVTPLRSGIRLAVIGFLMLGALLLGVFLRIYALNNSKQKYAINIGMMVGIPAIWTLMFFTEFPAKYLKNEFFSPSILAFSDLAPSLGALTINLFALGIMLWLLYTHLFRIVNLLYYQLIRRPMLAWPAMLLTLTLCSWGLDAIVELFRTIIMHSQVDIEYSNLFKTNIYSFIILLDIGILLLTASLIMSLLLRLNILYGRKYSFSFLYVLLQSLLLVVVNTWLHKGVWPLALISVLSISLIGYSVYRMPFRPILHQDLINYLILLLVFSTLVTYHVVVGIDLSNEVKTNQIAESILTGTTEDLLPAITRAIDLTETDADEYRKALEELPASKVRDRIRTEHFTKRFKEFEVHLFMYDSLNRRLDIDSVGGRNPIYPPESGVLLSDIADSVPLGKNENIHLYQLQNPDNRYIDIYTGDFTLPLGTDSARNVRFLFELKPRRGETEGLYPSLTLTQNVFDEIQLFNSFDHALYRKGILSYQRGNSSFPPLMTEYRDYKNSSNRIRGQYQELIRPMGSNPDKLIVIRYPRQDFFNVITSFSFIFYFFSLGALVLLVLPVMALRTLRSRRFIYHLPLRTRIRFSLLTISVLPMLVIMGLLYPFVSQRYNEQAKEELVAETTRLTHLLAEKYANASNKIVGIQTARSFREEIEKLEELIQNDVNIYDKNGRLMASTQPAIFASGISSDLMNSNALEVLSKGERSDLILEERMGSIRYISAFRPISGANGYPIGYLNIPYLGRQDQLEDQVINFLAYLANIYLVVFLLINIVAVAISGTITRPLTMIQQRISATSLGSKNEPIRYEARDEIGAIVTAYNQMVEQISESENQLKQTQRELAWRQMARQVAHEIKNPLTPMRLNIQHLTRAWNEQTPRLEKMFPNVMKTLLSQIDSLVRIANSFSEFAKMPEPVKTRVNLNEVLLEVIDLYSQSEEAIWLTNIPQDEFWIFTDRDQISRCFNNIIKNALQAIEGNGIINISMRSQGDRARVEIKDNGKGIPEEIQARVFEPSFSTKTSGMGLGLAIVKRIVENSGGAIWFQSRSGEGTTFFVELPAAGVEIRSREPEKTTVPISAG